MAKLYKTNGEIEEVKPKYGKHFTLKELQAMVSGYIELVPTIDGKLMFVNELGRNQRLIINMRATRETFGDYVILGDAVVCEHDELEH